jgi:isopenicillin N synthase-like dioxygenase
MFDLPVINLEALHLGTHAEQRAAARSLGDMCRDAGFFCVTGHGVSRESKALLFKAAREFFNWPTERKNELSIDRSPHNRGYVGLETERLNAAAPPDQKEAFNIGLELSADHPEILAKRPLRGLNFWPDISGWRATMLAYYDRCMQIGRILHRGFSLDFGLSEHFFDEKLDAPAAILRLLRYPARVSPPKGSASEVRQPDAPGAGEHTDYGNVTLLMTDGVAGLEIRHRDGTWLEVADTQDLLLCNIGDCLMRWTNDEYRSTPHRVRVPLAERHSIAFFLDANPDALVDPSQVRPNEIPRYPPISVRDYLLGRLTATYEHLEPAARG